MNNNKKMYIKPTIKIIDINKQDIITTSEGKKITEVLFGPGGSGVKLS